MDLELIGGVLAVPVIVAIVELAKQQGLPARWAMPLAVGLGLAMAALVFYFGASPLYQHLVRGLLAGLAAAGLYSGVKAMRERRP